MGYSDCTESLVLQKLQKIDFENEVVFVAEYKKKVIGFIHAQIYDVLYYESMVNILGLAVDSKFTKNGTRNSNCFESYKSFNNSSSFFRPLNIFTPFENINFRVVYFRVYYFSIFFFSLYMTFIF